MMDKPSSSDETKALLSKSFSGSIEEAREEQGECSQYSPISFNYGPRSFRDIPFFVILILFSLCTFAFGIFAVVHRNPNFSDIESFKFDSNSSSCVRNSTLSMEFNGIIIFMSSSTSHPFVKDLIWTLVVTVFISGPFVLGLLWLLRRYTKQIVYISIPFFVVIPVFLNVFWFVACTVNTNCRDSVGLAYRILLLVFIFLIIGVIIWIIVANWDRVELTVLIVGVASETLAKNMGLFIALPALTLGLLVYYVPIVVFLIFSRFNGKIVPRIDESDEYSCTWKEDRWVPAYFALAILTMLWSASAMIELKAYVISETVARWYFSKEEMPARSIRNSLRNAFSTSFGTICFSGLLTGTVRVVRAIVDSARREDSGTGFVNAMLKCCDRFLLSALDFLNKFTINFAAITGESYCSSSKMTYELLRRNLFSAVFVETVSTRILVGIIFVLSAIYATAVGAILKAVSALGAKAYLVAAIAWLVLIVVLGFFVHVLENVIDTVYVCYAIDRDKGEVCKQDVHDVYVRLPISRNNKRSHIARTPRIV